VRASSAAARQRHTSQIAISISVASRTFAQRHHVAIELEKRRENSVVPVCMVMA
jgi:hypothetical protein